jgi:dephospho-CoA kinase
MKPAVRLGLTGGIGSGKSTVAQVLVERGAVLVDADAIARHVTLAGGLAIPALVSAFGPDCLAADGAMDREKMRLRVYEDASARQRLESIIHPLVGQETERQAAFALSQGAPCIVFDVPLLVESNTWRQKVHRVLVVDCTTELQISRVMVRNQLTRAAVEKILASQASRERRLQAADFIIFNANLSMEQLANEVDQLTWLFGLSSNATPGSHRPTNLKSA